MESNFAKYRDEGSHVVSIVAGTAIKYASLLAGIYSVCKDEKDFAIATVAGLTYLVGEGLQRKGTQLSDVKKFSKLEETLKQE